MHYHERHAIGHPPLLITPRLEELERMPVEGIGERDNLDQRVGFEHHERLHRAWTATRLA